MRGFTAFIVMLVIFIAGLFAGAELGVLGKPTEIYLQTNYDDGVVPYFSKGDRIHWIDPSQNSVDGKIPATRDVGFIGKDPCSHLDSNGVCVIDVASGTYRYSCKECGDPVINLGGGGPNWVSPPHPPGSGDQTESYSFKRSLVGFARAFIAAFFIDEPARGEPVNKKTPDVLHDDPPKTTALAPCDNNGLISVVSPDHWYPGTTFPLPLGTKVKWGNQDVLPATFTVQNLAGSTDLTDACGATPLAANATGNTPYCSLSTAYPRDTVHYTIVDTRVDQTKACHAPAEGFALTVKPASHLVIADTVPSLR